jgi:hypothetical protein
VCQAWQSSLSELVKAPYPLALIANAPIDDPSTSGPEGSGYGCFIDLSSDGPLFRVNMGSIQSFLSTQGFKNLGSINNPCTTPSATSALYTYGRACAPGRTSSWVDTKSDQQQKVVVELISRWPYRSTSSFSANSASPTPSPDGTITPPSGSSLYGYDPCLRFFTGAPCQPGQAYQESRFVMRIGIATTAIRQSIDGFLYQWASGQSSTMTFVSSQLRASLPDLASLDKMVGILRRPDLTVRLTWQIAQNTGQQVWVETNADEPSALALPDQHSGPFEVVFSQVAGKWQVSSVTLGTLSGAN